MQEYFKNGYYVKFRLSGSDNLRYWLVQEREGLKYDTDINGEFSVVAAGNSSGDITIDNLEPSENELYYIIPSFKDGCAYRFRIPSGNDRNGVAKDTTSGTLYNRDSPYFFPNPAWSFYVAIKTKFQINATNESNASLTPRVFFEGIKYRVIEVTDKEKLQELISGKIPSTSIQLGGFSK